MTHTTVLLIVDAGRSDYVRPDSMPFLSGLAKNGVSGALESPAGFAQRTVLFTGQYPDSTNNFGAFVFDPAHSPFRWIRRLGPLRRLIKPRRVLSPTRIGISRLTRRVAGVHNADPAWIPPVFLPFFRPCEDMRPVHESGALGVRSIFDLCRSQGLTFRYFAHAERGEEPVHASLVRELRAGSPCDLYVAQVSVMDQMGHVDGPISPDVPTTSLRVLDERLASIHAALGAAFDSWDLIVVGDHGMAPVKRRVDVLKILAGLDVRPAKDYVVFVNSTLVAFWYLTEKGRSVIEAALPHIEGTHVIEAAEQRRLRIPSDRKWGDRMLAAEPGVLFWPDFFHVTDSTVRGMHGYLDKGEENHGTLVLTSSDGESSSRDVGLRPLVDVFPTLCDLLGIAVPEGQEGKSLVRLVRAHGPSPAEPEGGAAAVPASEPVDA